MKHINPGFFFLGGYLILEGFFPIFSFFALQSLETIWLVALATAASILFGLIFFIKDKQYLAYKNRDIVIPTMLSGFFLGMGGLLYFFGIKYSSPSIAATLLLLQGFFAYLIFNVFGEEECHIKETIGAILMPVGGAIILYKGEDFINLGGAIMILACLMMTIGNLYTKKANKHGTNPMFLITNRNFIVLLISIIFAYIYVGPIEISQISENLVWIIAIGVLILFAAKVLFAMTLARVKGFIAISFFPAIPLFVLLFSYIFLGEIPSLQQILGFVPIFIGSYLLVKKH